MNATTIIRIIVAALLVALLVTILPSCKTPQPIVQTEVKEVIVEREVRDISLINKKFILK